MRDIAMLAFAMLVLACGSRKDSAHDELGCRIPEGYATGDTYESDMEDYETCREIEGFKADCLRHGGEDLGSLCRRLRPDGKREYLHLKMYPYSGSYPDFKDRWEDCKPHARPYVEPGDPTECLLVEPGDDPSKVHWRCVAEPLAWCPPNP